MFSGIEEGDAIIAKGRVGREVRVKPRNDELRWAVADVRAGHDQTTVAQNCNRSWAPRTGCRRIVRALVDSARRRDRRELCLLARVDDAPAGGDRFRPLGSQTDDALGTQRDATPASESAVGR